MLEAEREYRYLQTPAAIREKAGQILSAAEKGELEHFRLSWAELPKVAARVIEVTRAAYPDFAAIPYHGRYRHFDAGKVPRLARFLEHSAQLSPDERLRAATELVIVSVLLDAGAGPDWSFSEPGGGRYARSEGLAVASYHLFMSGALSKNGEARVDAERLASFDAAELASAFQVTPQNPLTGLEGRAALLRALGKVVLDTPDYFAARQLGDLGVYLKQSAHGTSAGAQLAAKEVLAAVLGGLGAIWPGREQLAGKPLGDVWRHSRFGLVPFHKLSQWLSYSLLEPLEAAGVTIVELDQLTGLPEYRNGGLFLDAGLLELRDPTAAEREHQVGSNLVIEWRALTVALLDCLAQAVRTELGLSPNVLPLARVLEGGSWSTGRALAAERRPGGGPPLRVVSDGTVF